MTPNAAAQRRYRSAHPGYQRARHLDRHYGLSVAGYLAIVHYQQGKCAICKQPTSLHVDHCHKTGRVRQGLCIACNTGLGAFKDSPMLLSIARNYLAVP